MYIMIININTFDYVHVQYAGGALIHVVFTIIIDLLMITAGCVSVKAVSCHKLNLNQSYDHSIIVQHYLIRCQDTLSVRTREGERERGRGGREGERGREGRGEKGGEGGREGGEGGESRQRGKTVRIGWFIFSPFCQP